MAWGDNKGTFENNAVSIGTSIATGGAASGVATVNLHDLIFVVVGEQTTPTMTTVADNLGNTYTATQAALDDTSVTGRAYYTVVTVPGTITAITATTNGGTNNGVIVAASFQGPFATSSVVDKNPTTTRDVTSSFSPPTTGTLDHAGAGRQLVVAWGFASGSAAWTATAPNTPARQIATASVMKAAIGYQTVTATTAVIPAWTGTNPTDGAHGQTTFRSTAALDDKAGSFDTTAPVTRVKAAKFAKAAAVAMMAMASFVPQQAEAEEETTLTMTNALEGAVIRTSNVIFDTMAGPVREPEVQTLVDVPQDLVRRRKLGRGFDDQVAFVPPHLGQTPTLDLSFDATPELNKRLPRTRLNEPESFVPQPPTEEEAETLTSTMANAIDQTVIRRSNVIFDAMAGPLRFVAPDDATTLPFNDTTQFKPPAKRKPFQPISNVLEIPVDVLEGEQVIEESRRVKRARKSLSDVARSTFYEDAGPDTTTFTGGQQGIVVRHSKVIGDDWAGPFPFLDEAPAVDATTLPFNDTTQHRRAAKRKTVDDVSFVFRVGDAAFTPTEVIQPSDLPPPRRIKGRKSLPPVDWRIDGYSLVTSDLPTNIFWGDEGKVKAPPPRSWRSNNEPTAWPPFFEDAGPVVVPVQETGYVPGFWTEEHRKIKELEEFKNAAAKPPITPLSKIPEFIPPPTWTDDDEINEILELMEILDADRSL